MHFILFCSFLSFLTRSLYRSELCDCRLQSVLDAQETTVYYQNLLYYITVFN